MYQLDGGGKVKIVLVTVFTKCKLLFMNEVYTNHFLVIQVNKWITLPTSHWFNPANKNISMTLTTYITTNQGDGIDYCDQHISIPQVQSSTSTQFHTNANHTRSVQLPYCVRSINDIFSTI